METFLVFAGVGFVAQLIDGALGMGYGVIAASVLLAVGVPPAHVSASVHAAKLFTTATSAVSHMVHGNVTWPLFRQLALGGCIGGVLGVLLLTSLPGEAVRPYVVAYLGIIGLLVLWKAFNGTALRAISRRFALPLGGAGGFLDAIGGGGWGPVVTSSLIGRGGEPRFSIGSSNAAEFVVTMAITSAFMLALLSGHWEEARGLEHQALAVAGLIGGGLPAAVLAGVLLKRLPARGLTAAVGILLTAIAVYQAVDMRARDLAATAAKPDTSSGKLARRAAPSITPGSSDRHP